MSQLEKPYSQNLQIIGDAHGDSLAFQKSLATIGDIKREVCEYSLGLSFEQEPELAPKTQVVSLGDLIDRGDDSLGVISQILELRENASAKDSTISSFEYICGNHEALLLRFLYLDDPVDSFQMSESLLISYIKNGGLSTLASLSQIDGAPKKDGFVQVAKRMARIKIKAVRDSFIDQIMQEYAGYISDLRIFLRFNNKINQFFSGMNLAVQNQDVLCVHAGFLPQFLNKYIKSPQPSMAEANETWLDFINRKFQASVSMAFEGDLSKFALYNQASQARHGRGVAGPLWADKSDIDDLTSFQRQQLVEYYQAIGVHTVVVGHCLVDQVTAVDLSTDDYALQFVYIDTGISHAYGGGSDQQSLIRDVNGRFYHIDEYGDVDLLGRREIDEL